MFYSEELLMADTGSKLYLVAAGMSYVPGHTDAGQASGYSDGNGVQTPIKCLCLLRSDGAAKAIPFAFYNENDQAHLAPTDEQIAAASWVSGEYPSNYNSGYYNNYSSAVGPLNTWIPAIASDQGTGIGWSIPQISLIRFVRNESLVMWGWPIKKGSIYSCQISDDYSVTVVNKVCRIYYQGNLVKTITNAN